MTNREEEGRSSIILGSPIFAGTCGLLGGTWGSNSFKDLYPLAHAGLSQDVWFAFSILFLSNNPRRVSSHKTLLASTTTCLHIWVWVKNRVTPKWVARSTNGDKD